jgi:hypothetical protein
MAKKNVAVIAQIGSNSITNEGKAINKRNTRIARYEGLKTANMNNS